MTMNTTIKIIDAICASFLISENTMVEEYIYCFKAEEVKSKKMNTKERIPW
jgi:hypothetical protein